MPKKIYFFGTASVLFLLLLVSCKDEVLPNPSSQLRLDYPVAEYAFFENHCPVTFEMNNDAFIKEDGTCGFSISYPKMKATIYLTYKGVHGDIDSLLKDAQNLTYKHVIKADDIVEQPYLNPEKNGGCYQKEIEWIL